MPVEFLTKQQLADRFGRDIRTITNWMAAGMPVDRPGDEQRFDWHACLAWREQQIREDARATRHADDNEERRGKLADANLRKALNEAASSDIELAKKRSEVVLVAYMAAEFQRIGLALRGKLLALPSAWAPRLGPCKTTVERQLVLVEAVNEAMPILEDLITRETPPPAEHAVA